MKIFNLNKMGDNNQSEIWMVQTKNMILIKKKIKYTFYGYW